MHLLEGPKWHEFVRGLAVRNQTLWINRHEMCSLICSLFGLFLWKSIPTKSIHTCTVGVKKKFAFRFRRTTVQRYTVFQETVREPLRNGTERCVLRAYCTVFRIFTCVPYCTVFRIFTYVPFRISIRTSRSRGVKETIKICSRSISDDAQEGPEDSASADP